MSGVDPTTGEVALGPDSGEVVVADPVTGEVQRLPRNDAVANLGFARGGNYS